MSNGLQEYMNSIKDLVYRLANPADSVDHTCREERIKYALEQAYLSGYAQYESEYEKDECMSRDKDRKFRGRKIILNWGKLKIEVSKLPYQNGMKDPVFDLTGSNVVLANVYKDSNGMLTDEIIGAPTGPNDDGTCLDGKLIKECITNNEYWMTVGEFNNEEVFKMMVLLNCI